MPNFLLSSQEARMEATLLSIIIDIFYRTKNFEDAEEYFSRLKLESSRRYMKTLYGLLPDATPEELESVAKLRKWCDKPGI